MRMTETAEDRLHWAVGDPNWSYGTYPSTNWIRALEDWLYDLEKAYGPDFPIPWICVGPNDDIGLSWDSPHKVSRPDLPRQELNEKSLRLSFKQNPDNLALCDFAYFSESRSKAERERERHDLLRTPDLETILHLIRWSQVSRAEDRDAWPMNHQ